jgi:hypothetical protein
MATRIAPKLRHLIENYRAASIPVIGTLFDGTYLGLNRPHALAFPSGRPLRC